MDRKPKRRTRERILTTALACFNRQGEPSVTTSAIAAEMEISQGNLYYHFHNKEEIVIALFCDDGLSVFRTFAVCAMCGKRQ